MDPFEASVPTLAISADYMIWNAYRQTQIRREKQLRSRVAYLLWVAAHHEDETEEESLPSVKKGKSRKSRRIPTPV